jgi:hypothetical protein
MEEIGGVILVVWFAIATTFTIQFAITDYRNFNSIVKQCEKQGFIQDNTVRVSCTVKK